MSLEPLLNAPLIIQLHVATLVPAWLIGTWVIFFSRRGSRLHRTFGYAFLGLVTVTSLISIFIRRAAPDSPFFGLSFTHITVPWALFLVYMAIDTARKGKIKAHRLVMIALYWGSLTIVGISNALFLKHGVTHEVFYPPAAQEVQLAP